MSDTDNKQHEAELEFTAGPARLHVSVRISTSGLLAIGAMVSGIILSVAPLVWVASSVARERPIAPRIGRRLG
jgi:hypothetical protein